tara:strand:+ start:23728 stop:24681 length:954 start_codon:yes stop_codon:yes gene_type:complete
LQLFEGVDKINQHDFRSVVTIGNFDGVHLGHQALIQKCISEAKKKSQKAVVLSFRPHPIKVLFPEKNIKKLFSYADQEKRLQEFGVDFFVRQPFSRDLSDLSAERFLNEIVIKPLNPSMLVVGYDFAFGANREGTIEYLKEYCKTNEIELHVQSPVRIEGEIVSSSLLRSLVAEGRMALAAKCLGRNFYLQGVVEKGAGRGKQIGFPTANIFTSSECFPKNGVYTSKVLLNGRSFASITNVGENPTFEDKTRRPVQVETHILDFDQDIYGDILRVEFVEFLRAEKKFSGVDQLVEQIKEDVIKAREYHEKMGSDFKI